VVCQWISTSCVALAAKAVRWRIEQAEGFREEVERYTDAERVVLADAYQVLLRYGPLPHPASPLAIHRFRDPRAGEAYVLVLPADDLRAVDRAARCCSISATRVWPWSVDHPGWDTGALPYLEEVGPRPWGPRSISSRRASSHGSPGGITSPRG
jgi:hypothetical protein